jgi:hypothetical protein
MMNKEALGDVSYSTQAAKEIIEMAISRLEDCGFDECQRFTEKKILRDVLKNTIKTLNMAYDNLEFIKNEEVELI